jgi:hypothetical protein
MIKSIQYVSLSLLLTIFLEGMLTLGSCFNFNDYNAFAWIAQAVVVTVAVTTALRIQQDEEGK